MFSETWLDDDYDSKDLGLRPFTIHRSNRTHVTSVCENGGGVLIDVRIHFTSVVIHSDPTLEQLFVSVKLDDYTDRIFREKLP